MTYPLSVQWTGGLVAPAYGTYKFKLLAPAGATLEIDGRHDGDGHRGQRGERGTRVVLAKGVHQVRLVGTLPNAQGAVELRWGTDNGTLVPMSRACLWNGPAGALLGTGYATVSRPERFYRRPRSPAACRGSCVATACWAGAGSTPAWAARRPSNRDWRGTLHAPQTGA